MTEDSGFLVSSYSVSLSWDGVCLEGTGHWICTFGARFSRATMVKPPSILVYFEEARLTMLPEAFEIVA